MIERRAEASLALEPRDGLIVAGELEPQHLDGDVATHAGLVGAVPGPHAADADLLLNSDLLEQERSQQRVGHMVVAGQYAPVGGAILSLAPELRTAAKADLPHVGKLP